MLLSCPALLTPPPLTGGLTLGILSKGEKLKHWFSALKQTNQTHSQWHSLSLDGADDVKAAK